MLLVLRSLFEEQTGNAVIVSGEGVAANAQIGEGVVLTTARGGVGKRRRKPRSRQRDYWTPVRMPVVVPVPVPITVIGEGVQCSAGIGRGNVQISVGLSDDEILAILMMAADETPVRRKMRILQRAVESGYSPAEAPGLLDQACDALAEHCAAN